MKAIEKSFVIYYSKGFSISESMKKASNLVRGENK